MEGEQLLPAFSAVVPTFRSAIRAARLTGSESIALSITATAAVIVVVAYLGDRIGLAFTPLRMLILGVVSLTAMLVGLGRDAVWSVAETPTFAAIVVGTFGWLMWIARPTFFPLGHGPDLTHHLLLINFIEGHWRLVHDTAVMRYLGEMVAYTPGSHILTALAGAYAGSNGLHVIHAVMSASTALKSGFVFLIATRLLDGEAERVPTAALASIALFASQIYFLGSFAEYSFLAQVVSEWFAIAMWWTLIVWDVTQSRWVMAMSALVGAAVFLTWPILIGPPLVLLGVLVLLPNRSRFQTRVVDALVATIPIGLLAVIFSIGRLGFLRIAGAGGLVTAPAVRAYGGWFLALSSAGIVISARDIFKAGDRTRRTLALTAGAILLQSGALYLYARYRGNDPYMARKMFYMLLYVQAVGIAVLAAAVWNAFAARTGRRAARYGPWAALVITAIVIGRPLVGGSKLLLIGQRPEATRDLEQAGVWVRQHVDPQCVEYLVGDDDSAYWLHLAVLGNPRRGARTADNTTYELTPALVRWLTPGGLPYAIADLRAIPSDIRDSADIVARFGSAAVIKPRGPSHCSQ